MKTLSTRVLFRELATGIALLFFAACGPTGVKDPAGAKEGREGGGGPSGPPAIDDIVLEKRADGLFYRTGEDKPFSGTDIEPDRKKAEEENRLGFVVVTPYQDGRIHGTMKIYYRTGDLQEDRVYENGAAKLSTIYYAGMAKKTHVAFNAKGVAEGPYLRWHPNGKVHTEGTFDENEKFHGPLKKFDEAGNLIAHYTLEHGKITEVHAESPAQKEDRLKKSGPLPGEE